MIDQTKVATPDLPKWAVWYQRSHNEAVRCATRYRHLSASGWARGMVAFQLELAALHRAGAAAMLSELRARAGR